MDSALKGKLPNANVPDEVTAQLCPDTFRSVAAKTEAVVACSSGSTASLPCSSERDSEIKEKSRDVGMLVENQMFDFERTASGPSVLSDLSKIKEKAAENTTADEDSSEYSAVPVEVVMLDEEPSAGSEGNLNLKVKPLNGSLEGMNTRCGMSETTSMETSSRNLRMRVNRESQSSKEPAKAKRSYLCNTCGTSFNKKGHLTAHIKMHTGEKPFSCKLCNSQFSLAHHLREHMMSHSGVRPFLCVLCNARFTQAGNLRVHIHSVHAGHKPYNCQHCELRFTQRSQLKSHMTTHSREKPYACDVCDARFGFTSGLRAHKKIHTGEKPYACDVCKSRFSLSHHLKAHKRTHTGEKPFACNQCDSRFSDSRYLKNHKKIHAFGESPRPGTPE